MNVSIVIPTLNEGPDLEATVALCLASKWRPTEIIVIDDCSKRPVSERLASFDGVTVIRNDRRLGSSVSKHRGVAASTGDLVVVCDAHVRPAWDWLDRLVAAHKMHPTSILAPISKGFDSDCQFVGLGCLFTWSEGYYKATWAPFEIEDGPYVVPCVMGGVYAMPRALLEDVGGFAPGLRGWGYEEEYLCLRAWMRGWECRTVPNVEVPHQYTRSIDREDANGERPDPWEFFYNVHVAMAVVFGEEEFLGTHRPWLASLAPSQDLDLQLTLDAQRIRTISDRVRAGRVLSNTALREKVAMPMRDPPPKAMAPPPVITEVPA